MPLKKFKGVDLMLRKEWPFYGKRFIGNLHTHEVHDLDNEQEACEIDNINSTFALQKSV